MTERAETKKMETQARDLQLEGTRVKRFKSAATLVTQMNPTVPVIGMRPLAAARAARWLLANFPGDVAYAYKANDNPLILGALYGAGVRHFDVASIDEVAEASTMPEAHLHFMHPVKPRDAIRLAYFGYRVSTFSLDTPAELDKIVETTNGARDVALLVRVAIPSRDSVIALDRKFGIEPAGAVELLKSARAVADKVGISFHVGSQMLR